MKFLVDANLPASLSNWLIEKGYESHHTSELSSGNKTNDKILFSLSMQNNWIVITKDNDFLERFFLMSEPKKLIFVRTGNLSNKKLISLFDSNSEFIFNSIEKNSLIEISLESITILS